MADVAVFGMAVVFDPEAPADTLLLKMSGKIVGRLTDVRKRGRPATGFDKAAYQRELMRKRRAAKKDKP